MRPDSTQRTPGDCAGAIRPLTVLPVYTCRGCCSPTCPLAPTSSSCMERDAPIRRRNHSSDYGRIARELSVPDSGMNYLLDKLLLSINVPKRKRLYLVTSGA
jgi:hypothetical protein